MESRNFLQELDKIKTEINSLIPLATNRFEEYETCPAELDLSGQDEIDRKFKLHEARVSQTRHDFQIFEHINSLFTEFCRNKSIHNPTIFTDTQRNEFKDILLSEGRNICARLERTQKYLRGSGTIDTARVEAYLSSNSARIVERLCLGEALSIEDEELTERFKKDMILVNYREISRKQIYSNNVSLLASALDVKHRERLNKYEHLYRGVYFDRIGTNVGYCDEHTCIGLKRILERRLLKPAMYIEKVSISYEEGDGHTFLAINRDPDSKLSDISSWGLNAILFDPWNKLVCTAHDFSSLPTYYFSYPNDATWRVDARFENDDYRMLDKLGFLDTSFAITGNTDVERRIPELIDEYHLVSVDQKGLEITRLFLQKILQKVKPADFNHELMIFITTGGCQPVRVIYGFPQPAISVHKEFLNDLLNGRASVSEMEYGLAFALTFIKHFPLGGDDILTDIQSHELDSITIELTRNGDSAISYLRLCIQYEDKYKNADDFSMDNVFNYTQLDSESDKYQKRIKNLATFLAKDEKLREKNSENDVPDGISGELTILHKYKFFIDGFNACKDKVKKIKYLEKCLPELKNELLPYELTDRPSVRLREYCYLIGQIQIDISDANQAKAVDDMVDQASSLKIPGLDRVYRSLLGLIPDVRNFYYVGRFSKKLQPLGKFKKLQAAITDFIQAENTETAMTASERIRVLDEELINHYHSCYIQNDAMKYFDLYTNTHHKKQLAVTERYFGSTIGTYIEWAGFSDAEIKDNILPWDKYMAWLQQDKSGLLARTLWRLGVVRDMRLWSGLDNDALFSIMESEQSRKYSNVPFIKLTGKLEPYSDDSYLYHSFEDMLNTLSARHKLDTSMFTDVTVDFEQAFIEFYDKNYYGLICPCYERNTNNETVKYLMSRFADVVFHGNEQQKAVVKGFYLGRDDHRDLKNLGNDIQHHTSFKYASPYVRFFIEQQYDGRPFQLFTVEEALSLISLKGIIFSHDDIPPNQFIRVFNLPFPSLDLPCLETLVPLMIDNDQLYNLGSVIEEHMNNHKYILCSRETARIARLTVKTYQRSTILSSINWSLPDTVDSLTTLDSKDLITIYRIHDETMMFPSLEQHKKFNGLIIDKIKLIEDIDNKIEVLEYLLFTQNTPFILPVTDLSVRNLAVELWVSCQLKKYGYDNGTPDYFQKISAIINKVKDHVTGRDITYILAHLADGILSQQLVSDHIGELLEPEKYLYLNQTAVKKPYIHAITGLAKISSFLGKDRNDQVALLDFLATPITSASTHKFAEYIFYHKKAEEIAKALNFKQEAAKDINFAGTVSRSLYYMFWDRPLEERAVIINYLMIPPDKMVTAEQCKDAYNEAFTYVANILFPEAKNPDSDDNLAVAFLRSYLAATDEYTRGYFLAGLVVASNESYEAGQRPSLGKKLALLCEHFGPAYVKLAQAIHSHPKTPEHIRRDLDHIKGKANPPYRWQLWRMVSEVLPRNEKNYIKYMGSILGSASYNLAIKVQLQGGQHVVLTLLRENAEKDAKNGFQHLRLAISGCDHPRVVPVRSAVKAVIDEAELLSEAEMNHDKSRQQFATAFNLYQRRLNIDGYEVQFKPTRLIRGGKGYRYVELMHGIEFNDLLDTTPQDMKIRKIVAKAVLTVEIMNILHGEKFDSDRHGNQMRVWIDSATRTIKLGLYDFGEMALTSPTARELSMLADVIKCIPKIVKNDISMGQGFDAIMSECIDKWSAEGHSTSYLMRVRKALLALQDFQKHLTNKEMIDVLVAATKSTSEIHPVIRSEIKYCRRLFRLAEVASQAQNCVKKVFHLFKPKEVHNNLIVNGK